MVHSLCDNFAGTTGTSETCERSKAVRRLRVLGIGRYDFWYSSMRQRPMPNALSEPSKKQRKPKSKREHEK